MANLYIFSIIFLLNLVFFVIFDVTQFSTHAETDYDEMSNERSKYWNIILIEIV